MSPWARRLPFVAVLGGLACENQSVAPAGTPSSATIRVYVDADGSAAFAAGDLAIAGLTVVLTHSGGSALAATTDGQGLATFPAVPAGVHVATLEGTVPAGAVLGTAARLHLEAPFQGDALAAEFRFVYLPGSLTGLVFRDDDTNGVYTPGTDFAGAGMDVALFAGTDTTADPAAEALSDAGGQFTFARIRPGTYTLRIAPPFVTMSITGGPLRTVDIGPAGDETVDVLFTGTAIQSVAAAKGAAGQVVTIEGVVSAGQGTYRTQGDNLYMQDASAGIQVFDLAPGQGLVAGDTIRVTGLMGAFAGEQEIVRIDATTLPTAVRLGTGAPPAPRAVSASDIVARTYEGELVTVTDAVCGTIPGGTSAAYNITFTAPPNVAFTMRIEAGAGATVPRTFWTEGATYSLAGALGSFNGTAQLKPRGTGDIVFGAAPVQSIADAKLVPAGDTVSVAGVVSVAQFTFRTAGDNIYLQDNTSGIQVFNLDPALALAVGDSVKITGLMGAFSGELQIVRFAVGVPPAVVEYGVGATPVPRLVTVAELNARTYEGELVQITDAMLTVIGSGTTSYNLTFDVGGTTFTGRIEAGVGGADVPPSFWTVGNTYTLVGVLGSFNGTAQLKPRGAADITLQ